MSEKGPSRVVRAGDTLELRRGRRVEGSLRAALVLAAATLTGCASIVLVDAPQPSGHPERAASSAACTDGPVWVHVDGTLGILSAMGTASAAVKPEQWERDTGVDAGVSVAVLTVLSGVAAYSALTGNGRVNDCRTAQLQLTNARNRDAGDMREAGRAHDGSATRSAVPRAALLIGAPATWTRLLQRPRRLEAPVLTVALSDTARLPPIRAPS